MMSEKNKWCQLCKKMEAQSSENLLSIWEITPTGSDKSVTEVCDKCYRERTNHE